MKKLAIACGLLSASLLIGVVCLLANAQVPASPTGGLTVYNAPYNTFGNGQLNTLGSGTLASTYNLSTSAGSCTITGSGSVTSIAVSGVYAYSGGTQAAVNGGTVSLVNGQPGYSGTNGLALWATNLGTWTITPSASLGTSTSSSLSGSIGGLNGMQFLTASVTGTATAFSGTGAATASLSSASVSSGVSVPCSRVVLSCTTSGCLVSSTSASGTIPLPANIPLQIPAANVNQLWITGGTGNSLGYGWWR